ncbi:MULTISPECIES: glycosyltransferase family 4 protein [unclassified Pseudoalteromonas]|uniref:glycosyltransferase family 4 protein n=1 Tax=unclassified Pseudoalteromonas TaxID=194690 RepID=UPI0011080FD6|nr:MULTISPECIES: glycosyltransferase family 4 protein [unclassified Pseudoalteromonas]TMN81312.1 hypothetical protein CWB64_12130 [Pseudoalteromonas sp. S410]TMN89293.1 hypothetical protein CWB62_13120 [Pseudoalteromonas sp. S408]TMN95071.1 hypothetical protein CWB61_16015 [Pseudoalteromonas sp. S407]TMN96538.1 hypothetical protein CWB63_15660 [Pseudoalteromonas sp. S409]TMO07793.1 hypothetical protein CWB57_15330 [Pseudoalteromonas sp. S186]
MKKILVVGQFPPPITGESICNELIIDSLSDKFKIKKINSCIINDVNNVGVIGFYKVFKGFNVILKAIINLPGADFLYCTPGQSLFGLIRFSPVVLLSLVFRKKVFLHWHGYGVYDVLKSNRILKKLYFNNRTTNILLTYDFKLKLESLGLNLKNTYILQNFCEESHDSKFYEISTDKINILFLGGLMEEKGIDEFITVAQKLFAVANFHVCGSGNSIIINKLKQMQNNGYLTFHGSVTGKVKRLIWEKTQVFVLQTYYPTEGVPLTILEAMANKCSVITTYHNGIPETVDDAAIFVEKKSADSLQKEVIRLISNKDLLIEMQKKAFERSKLFSKSEFKKNILSLFMKT